MDGVDTGTIAEVPEGQRLDYDGQDRSDARGGGDRHDSFEDIYDDPGEVIREDLS